MNFFHPEVRHPYEVIRENLNRNKSSIENEKSKRNSPRWHDRLVDHFMDARREHEDFWAAVDAHYWQKDVQDLGAAPEVQLSTVKNGRVYSFVSLIESQVFSRAPKIYLKGLNEKHTKAQRVMERAQNTEFQENGHLKGEMKICARDTARYGWGIAMTSYEVDPKRPPRDAKEAEELRDKSVLDPAGALLEDQAEQAFSDAQARGRAPEEPVTYEQDERVRAGQMVTRRVPAKSFICDPCATSQYDWRWCGRVIIADKESVIEMARFENKDAIKTASEKDLERWVGPRRARKNPYEQVILYEIFERLPDGRWWLTVTSPGCDEFLRNEESPYWYGHPYSLCRWNQDGDGIFAQSDLLPIWTNYQSEILLSTKVIQSYARQQQDVTFYDEQIGDFNLDSVHNPNVARLIPISFDSMGGTKRLQDHFFRLPKDPISPDVLNLMGMIERHIMQGSGMGPNQFGQALKSETSASEANEIANYSRARGAHKSDGFEDFVRDITWKRLAGMMQFYTRSDVKRLVGPELGAEWPLDWAPTDVTSGLRVTVHPGSMRPENPQVRLQNLMSIFQVFMSNPALASIMDVPQFMNRLMREGFDIGEGDPILTGVPPELASQLFQAMGAQGSPAGSSVPGSSGQSAQFSQGAA